MKREMKKAFKDIFQGKRLLAVHLNGFSHSIIYDSGETDSEVENARYSLYTYMGDDKAETFFETLNLNHHNGFKHNAKEILFVSPQER